MAIKQKLGDLLVRDGLITESDLRTMLAQQRQHGGRLGEHLVRVNLCTEEQIAQALARQLNIPFNDMSDPPAPALSKLIPHEKATKFQALAMGNNPFASRLPVAFGDPTDLKATMEIEKVVGRPIQILSGPALLVRRAIEAAYNSIDLRDEGTSEFQVTDVRGGARSGGGRRRAERERHRAHRGGAGGAAGGDSAAHRARRGAGRFRRRGAADGVGDGGPAHRARVLHARGADEEAPVLNFEARAAGADFAGARILEAETFGSGQIDHRAVEERRAGAIDRDAHCPRVDDRVFGARFFHEIEIVGEAVAPAGDDGDAQQPALDVGLRGASLDCFDGALRDGQRLSLRHSQRLQFLV